MKTNKWLLRFAVVAILVCLSSSAHAQFREPAVLPNLAWRDATNTVESTMMWQGQLMQDFPKCAQRNSIRGSILTCRRGRRCSICQALR